MKLQTIITLLLILLYNSCEDRFKANIPTYIKIDNFEFNGNINTNTPYPTSYNSINIADSWVSIDGDVIGTFEMPFNAPILYEGIQSFDIYPGIKVNGIAANRIKYPFYDKFEIDIELKKQETIQINPITSYIDNITFPLEGSGTFEQTGTMFERIDTNDVKEIRQNYEVFQGQYSAAIYLDSLNNKFDLRCINELELPLNTFLELDFKSNISFNIGIIIINAGNIPIKEELIQLYPTDNWKKIYLDLYPLINKGNNNSKFKIYLDGQYNDLILDNAIYIDNLKLVHNSYD